MRQLLLILLAGCYVEARGGADLPVRHATTSSGSPQGSLMFGLYQANEKQTGALFLGQGVSPLVGADAKRLLTPFLGVRYDHVLRDDRLALRGFGRIMWGAGSDPDAKRWAGVTSIAFGVSRAWTHVPAESCKKGWCISGEPTERSIGLALTYTFVDDTMLGPADFFGLDLSLAAGFDPSRVLP